MKYIKFYDTEYRSLRFFFGYWSVAYLEYSDNKIESICGVSQHDHSRTNRRGLCRFHSHDKHFYFNLSAFQIYLRLLINVCLASIAYIFATFLAIKYLIWNWFTYWGQKHAIYEKFILHPNQRTLGTENMQTISDASEYFFKWVSFNCFFFNT